MRGGRIIDWSHALGVSPDELHGTLRALWREQEQIYGQQSKLRDRIHAVPDREIDAHLLKAERHIGEAAQLLGSAAADAARAVS
jgi:hypothetical protein